MRARSPARAPAPSTSAPTRRVDPEEGRVRIRRSSCATACLVLAAWARLVAHPSAQPACPSVMVMLQNEAGLRADLVARAAAEVVRLYSLIGVDIEWVTSVPENGGRLRSVCLVTRDSGEDLSIVACPGCDVHAPRGAGEAGARLRPAGAAGKSAVQRSDLRRTGCRHRTRTRSHADAGRIALEEWPHVGRIGGGSLPVGLGRLASFLSRDRDRHPTRTERRDRSTEHPDT